MKKVLRIIVVVVIVTAAFVLGFICRENSSKEAMLVSIEPIEGDKHTVLKEDGITPELRVYLGANSKLYASHDATSSEKLFLDIFDDVKEERETLAAVIDANGFPYSVPYEAHTVSEPCRYLIITQNGETYWVEP